MSGILGNSIGSVSISKANLLKNAQAMSLASVIAVNDDAGGVFGNAAGGFGMPKSYVIVDEEGNELTAVLTDNVVVFDATTNDVREGKIFANSEGVTTGTKNIPSYRTTKASKLILPNMSYSISLSHFDKYDYTEFQCVIAKRNTSIGNSVAVDKIVIEDNVYEVNSTQPLSQVTKNSDTKSIDLNLVNSTKDIYVIHYFTYREED